MDRLVMMNSFVAVAETRSFSAVAASLGYSRALVSRHIADLEKILGARLFNRTTRSVSLTEAGKRHLKFCLRMLSDLHEEESTIAGLREKAEGTLSVVTPKWIGNLQVGDAVTAFSLAYPKISVRCEIGHHYRGTHDFVGAGFDVAFQTKAIRDSSVVVKRIATLHYVLCASPAYLDRCGAPQRLENLAHHRTLTHVNEPMWHFNNGIRSTHIKLHDVAFSSNAYLLLQKAALAGMGIALLPMQSVSKYLEDGRLRLVLPDNRIQDRPLYITYAPGDKNVARVRYFVDFITAWFKRNGTVGGRAQGQVRRVQSQVKTVMRSTKEKDRRRVDAGLGP
jgi:DNA-binding transcriptional LysR family regulator